MYEKEPEMSIETDLQTFVTDDPDIRAVITERMFPVFASKDPDVPYITYRRLSTDRLRTHSGVEGRPEIRFLLTCWSTDYDEAISLADKLRHRVDATSTEWNSPRVHSCFVIDESDNFIPSVELLEKQYFGRDLTIEIRFRN